MPVLPYRIHPFQDCKTLYQFLSDCQHHCFEKNRVQIATLSCEIDPVDPLIILQKFSRSDTLHFYLEKPFAGEAIAALDTALTFETSGVERFAKVQDFLQTCSRDFLIKQGWDEGSLAGNWAEPGWGDTGSSPQFFCSFTFFDQAAEAQPVFPVARAFLPRWQISRRPHACRVQANLAVHPQLNLHRAVEEWWQQLEAIRRTSYGMFHLLDDLNAQLQPWRIADRGDFAQTVAAALPGIYGDHLNKLVLAHAIDVTSPLPFNWVHSLHRLRQLHPDCYVFSTSNGNGSVFLGASPERLIQVRQRSLETDALAGSAPRGKTSAQDAAFAQRLLSSQKERHEHQLVVDFIGDRLQRLGLLPQSAALPGLRQLSNIQHLHTPISAEVPTGLHPLEILAALHPTPAVAGLPRDLACAEIQKYERFGRSLYAAPLGWVDLQGNAEFLVGIRSALVQQNHARLFAGAGIVAGSDPLHEQAEVQLKLQALLKALA